MVLENTGDNTTGDTPASVNVLSVASGDVTTGGGVTVSAAECGVAALVMPSGSVPRVMVTGVSVVTAVAVSVVVAVVPVAAKVIAGADSVTAVAGDTTSGTVIPTPGATGKVAVTVAARPSLMLAGVTVSEASSRD